MALEVLGDGNLSIYENEPNGTIVGVFQGMDPNPGYTLRYSFAGIDESYQSLIITVPTIMLRSWIHWNICTLIQQDTNHLAVA